MSLEMLRRVIPAAILLAAACAPDAGDETATGEAATPETETETVTVAETVEIVESTCPDDGPRFPISGICVGRSVNYLDPNLAADEMYLPEGCTWEMREAQFALDILLYRAAACGEEETVLDFRGGAQSAALGYVSSIMSGGADVTDIEPVRIFVSQTDDPTGVIFRTMEGDTSLCEVRPVSESYLPKDALEFGPKADAPEGTYCGEYAAIDDGVRFWMIRQGYAWYIDAGQDMMDYDPASFTLLMDDGAGGWTQVEPPPPESE